MHLCCVVPALLCCVTHRQAEIVPFFTVIETERGVADMILDYSISQTTLEEVFLNVCSNCYNCMCISKTQYVKGLEQRLQYNCEKTKQFCLDNLHFRGTNSKLIEVCVDRLARAFSITVYNVIQVLPVVRMYS